MEYTIDEFSKFLYKNGITNHEKFLYDSVKENDKNNLENSANKIAMDVDELSENNYDEKIIDFLKIYLMSKVDSNVFDSVSLYDGFVNQDDEFIINLFKKIINIRKRREKNIMQKYLLKWNFNSLKLSTKAKYIAKLYYDDIKNDNLKINEADLIEDEILEDKSVLEKYNNNLSIEMTENLHYENTYDNDYYENPIHNQINEADKLKNSKNSQISNKVNDKSNNLKNSQNSRIDMNNRSLSKLKENENKNNVHNSQEKITHYDIYNKLFNDQKTKEERMRDFIRKRNREELRECTFKPSVNSYYWKKNKRSKSSISGKAGRNKFSNEYPIYIKLNNVSLF